MPYTGKSPIYLIPFMYNPWEDGGDEGFLSASSEKSIANRMDSNLYGAVFAHSGGIGKMDGYIYDASSPMGLIAGGSGIDAFINQINVFQDQVVWSGLSAGVDNYLYLQIYEGNQIGDFSSSRELGSVSTGSNTTGNIPFDAILIAKANGNLGSGLTFTEAGPRVILLSNHIGTNPDPHGSPLYQSGIVASGLNVLGAMNIEDLSVNRLVVSGNTVFDTIDVGTAIANTVVSNSMAFSGITVLGSSEFTDNLNMDSGITVDGVDLSETQFLIDGSVADGIPGHRHLLLQPTEHIFYSPKYKDVVITGPNAGNIIIDNSSDHNYYSLQGFLFSATLKIKTLVPAGLKKIINVSVWEQVYDGGDTIYIRVYDTTNTLVLNQAVTVDGTFTKRTMNISGTFEEGKFFTTEFDLASVNATYLGEIDFAYTT